MKKIPYCLSTAVVAVLLLFAIAFEVKAEDADQKIFDAKWVGHAVIPAMTFVAAPSDAPAALQISGRFTGPGNMRTDQLYSIEGKTWLAPADAPRTTGLYLPFVGQPVQGFSGIKNVGNDNNLPFSTGRAIGRADDNELILLDVGDMLTQP
jgi:hypothetical protein